MPICYKSASARKSLIFKDILFRKIFPDSGQTLDFSSPAAHGRPAFNKVIHRAPNALTNTRQIKDLDELRKAHPKLSRLSHA
jgi:hypothetical protein